MQGDSVARDPKLIVYMRNTGKYNSLDESNISRGSPSCFPSLPVCVYKFSCHYLNNINFYRLYSRNLWQVLLPLNSIRVDCAII